MCFVKLMQYQKVLFYIHNSKQLQLRRLHKKHKNIKQNKTNYSWRYMTESIIMRVLACKKMLPFHAQYIHGTPTQMQRLYLYLILADNLSL